MVCSKLLKTHQQGKCAPQLQRVGLRDLRSFQFDASTRHSQHMATAGVVHRLHRTTQVDFSDHLYQSNLRITTRKKTNLRFMTLAAKCTQSHDHIATLNRPDPSRFNSPLRSGNKWPWRCRCRCHQPTRCRGHKSARRRCTGPARRRTGTEQSSRAGAARSATAAERSRAATNPSGCCDPSGKILSTCL